MIPLNLKPSTKQLRNFGFIGAAFFGGLSVLVYWRQALLGWSLGGSSTTIAVVLGALAAVCLLFSLVYPRGNRPLFVTLTLITFPIGLAVSFVLMSIIFYLVISPIGAILRLSGRGIRQQPDPRKSSYWETSEPTTDVSRYFKRY